MTQYAASKKESLPMNSACAVLQGENPIAAMVAGQQCSSGAIASW